MYIPLLESFQWGDDDGRRIKRAAHSRGNNLWSWRREMAGGGWSVEVVVVALPRVEHRRIDYPPTTSREWNIVGSPTHLPPSTVPSVA